MEVSHARTLPRPAVFVPGLSGLNGSLTYDAAGRNVTTSSVLLNQFTGGSVTHARNGDGLPIKRSETRQGATTIGYRMHSTILGGRVVTELSASGQKQKSYVYLKGEVLAEQAGSVVTWKHTNPLTGSEGSSYPTGQYGPEKELDSMQVDVGFEDPYLNFEEFVSFAEWKIHEI